VVPRKDLTAVAVIFRDRQLELNCPLIPGSGAVDGPDGRRGDFRDGQLELKSPSSPGSGAADDLTAVAVIFLDRQLELISCSHPEVLL
jgi:hypothetical protein